MCALSLNYLQTTNFIHMELKLLYLVVAVLFSVISLTNAISCSSSGCVCDTDCSGFLSADWCYIDSLNGDCPDYGGEWLGKSWMYCGSCTGTIFCENSVTCPANSAASTPTCCPSGRVRNENGNCNKYQTCIPPTLAPTLKPTRQPTPPTFAPSTSPTKKPTFAPSRSPTKNPTLTPTTPYPTFDPTFAPTKEPTVGPTQFPSKNPTLSPTPPTTQRPSKNPTFAPSLSPTHRPSHNPSVSPTKAPIWKDVCTAEDGVFMVNYDNYATQAAKCANTCRLKLIQNNQPEPCIRSCVSFTSYTSLCRECMVFFLVNQQKQCSGPCLANKLSTDCVSCTNTTVRQDFVYCTGLSSQVQDGSGNGDGTSGFAPPEVDEGAIGGALGGIAGALVLAAAVVTARRIRNNRLVTDQLVNDVSANIFMKKDHVSRDSSNPLYLNGATKPTTDDTRGAVGAAASDGGEDIRGQQLRTRFSFRGIEEDELNVDAGASLTGISKNPDWVLCKDNDTGRIGLIPTTYVNNV